MSTQPSDFDILIEEAENENTSGERLEELATLSVDLAKLVASNLAAPPVLLKKLAKSENYTVRQKVFANPNAPIKILLRFSEHRQRFEEEAENENTSRERLKELGASSVGLAKIVLTNPTTPPELLQKLISKQDSTTLSFIASNPRTPSQVLYKLARRDWFIRRNLAANPNTPTDLLLKLGKDYPEELLNNPIWSLLLLENLNLLNQIPTETLISLLRYDSNRSFIKSIENDKTLVPELWLQKLVNHRSCYIRSYIARHPKTPVNLLDMLVEDNDDSVRKEVARNPNTPVNLLEKLAIDDCRFIRSDVAEHPNTDIDLLNKLALDDYYVVREKVAINPKTPVNLLVKLAENYLTKYVVAKNPNTPIYLLEYFGRQNCYTLHTAVASNVKTPSYLLENFIIKQYNNYQHHELMYLLPEVVSNPNTPIYILQKLAEKSVWQVRQIVAYNRNTPVYILEKLAQDDEPEVRKCIASNSKTPAYVLEKMTDFDFQKWNILKAIAKNHNASINTLEKLKNSKYPSVRDAARTNLSSKNYPDLYLEELMNNSESEE